MGFAFPLFLWALAAIAIPVIIHLFYFRRYKKVYFSTVRFLKEVKEQQKKAGKLQQLLVLASRIMAVIFLVLAFAQPFLGKLSLAGTGSERSLIVYIDNTFSMKQGDGIRDLLAEAKDHAATLINNLNAGDKVMLLTNDLEGSLQRWMNKQEAIQSLENIEFTASANDLAVLNKRISAIVRESPDQAGKVFYISDFQKYALPDQWTDTMFQSVFIPLSGSQQQNIYIDSIWLADPVVYRQAVNKMVVRLKNTGKTASSRLTLQLDGEIRSVSDVEINENGWKLDTLQFTLRNTGWQRGMVAVQDYPVTFDDRMHFAFEAASSNKVLLLEEVTTPRSVYDVFRSDAFFATDKIESGKVDFSSLPGYSLVVLNEVRSISQGLAQSLTRYVNDGGSLYIIPSDNGDVSSYNNLLNLLGAGNLSEKINSKALVSQLNEKDPVIQAAFEKIPRNVDLPEVKSYYSIGSASRVAERPLMRLDNGRVFMNVYRPGSGVAYLQASSLQATATDFPAKALFPPIVYNMAVFKANPRPLYYTAGAEQLIQGIASESGKDQVIYMKSGNYEWIPPVRPVGNQLNISIPSELDQDGVFDIVRSGSLLAVAALNFNRKESVMEFFSRNELATKYANSQVEVADVKDIYLTSGIGGLGKSSPLWKVFLILALVMLLMEVLLLRFFNTKPTQ